MLEAREITDIPIIPIAEATLHYACLLGGKIGVVTLQEKVACITWEKMLNNYGFRDRAIINPVRGVNLCTHEASTKGMEDPSIIVKVVKEKAEELVQDGAEVIVIGCGFYAPICTLYGLVKLEHNIPLLDPMAIGFKLAEVMVDLKTSIGLPALSRVGMYPRMPEIDVNRISEHVACKS